MAITLGINDLKEISNLISDKTGYPFNEMNISFLKRRLSNYFEKNFIKSKEKFIDQLNNENFIESILYNIPVDTTELFRDPGFWRTLQNKIFNDDYSIKTIWFPDSSSGEEIYSLLIIRSCIENIQPVPIIINHPSQSRIDEIKTGILTNKNQEINENNYKRIEIEKDLNGFFNSHNNIIKVNNELLDTLRPKKGWFLSPPPEEQSLVIFRNSMLYMNKQLQERVGLFLYEKLSQGGFLAIGIKETLPECISERMEVFDEQEKIYRKI